MYVRAKNGERTVTFLYQPSRALKLNGEVVRSIEITRQGIYLSQDAGTVALRYDEVEEYFPVIVEAKEQKEEQKEEKNLITEGSNGSNMQSGIVTTFIVMGQEEEQKEENSVYICAKCGVIGDEPCKTASGNVAKSKHAITV